MKMTKTTGVALAVAAAGMFTIAPMSVVSAGEGKVHCYGINKCKGHNDCKTANNACKGKGSCKGQGFINVSSKEECEKAGGKVGD